ncbi:Uncharacterised protein [Mycobacteroides abscessus]|nr:Uncharacterised protein [Mycobacteroides abscessus]
MSSLARGSCSQAPPKNAAATSYSPMYPSDTVARPSRKSRSTSSPGARRSPNAPWT